MQLLKLLTLSTCKYNTYKQIMLLDVSKMQISDVLCHLKKITDNLEFKYKTKLYKRIKSVCFLQRLYSVKQ